MGQPFDPYYKWLGIPPDEQPANHYRLLGLKTFETDPDVIQSAADQRMAHLRTYQTGQYADASQRLLNEVAVAKICLLNPARKPAYDEQLQAALPPLHQPPASVEAPLAALGIEADVLEPLALPMPPPTKKIPWGIIAAGAAAMCVVVIVGLVSRNGDSPKGSEEVATQTVPPAEGVKRPIAPETAEQSPDKEKSVPEGIKAKPPVKPPVQPTPPKSPPTPTKVATANQPSHAKLHLMPDPEPEQSETTDDESSTQSEKGSSDSESEIPARTDYNSKNTSDRTSTVPESGAEKSSSSELAVVPDAAAQEAAMKLARELYKDEFATAKSADEKQAFAKRLLNQAEDASSADAGTFILLRLARDISVQAANGETALAAISAMSERYQINAMEMKADALATCAKKARTPPQHVSLAEQASRLLEEATAAKDYVQAANLAKLVVAEGGLGRNKEIVVWAKSCLQDLQKKAKLVAEVEAARGRLATEPNDAAANQTVGMYHCYLQGDWDKAFPYLAKGDDVELQALAKKELASPPSNVEEQVAMADAWWDAAQNMEGAKRLAMLRRAGSWYSIAQSESVSGLSKVKVEKRLAELAKIERENATTGPAPRTSIPAGKWFSLLTSRNELTGWEVGECRFSYANRIIDLRAREMYCPIVAKDASIRAKIRRHSVAKVRLILRNCDEGCYFAQLTSGSWSIVKLTRNSPSGKRTALRMPGWGEEDTLTSVSVARNYSDAIFSMGFSAVGNTLTVYMNNQPILQAIDGAFDEGTVGIGTSESTGLFVTDVEMMIPKGSLVADHRTDAADKPGD